ncbi:serine/threonine-protein kinase [Spongiactinospora sp. TRM90649]|uniref:serine/threonine-protein kinase n=1 Tax=Spongiactinospora sp. TRM90649 TaxID=3031114 RepID=UPI0023F9E6B2|nr:serine/threonine-protein kinase [Spongiactinospora sp. TRM90649]MDF5753416.1 serine/threonine-protein kinase [Spongiactinospora sp. TRM90649]
MGGPDGEHLGAYRLLSSIGAGGFGEVHLALDPEGRTVAVKVLHPHVAADAGALARLSREVETMRRVRGDNVAEVRDASLGGRRPYLVTRYVQGRPLSTLVAEEGPIGGDGLLALARGLAAALTSIHGAGVVHRDLKPANVIVADGVPVVIDFGIAHALDSVSVTASGAVLGTPGYLAPEVIEGAESGAPADVFAFAATLAYAATGRQPYGIGPASAVAYRVVHQEPDLDGVPEWLMPLLRECLVREPAIRPTSAQVAARVGAPAALAGTLVGAVPPVASDGGGGAGAPGVAEITDVHALSTRQVGQAQRPGRTTPEDARAKQAAKVRTRWVIGSGAVAALAAAAASDNLPEVSLLVLAAYALGVLGDAAVGLLSREGPQRRRVVIDVGSGVGTVLLWLVLSSVFSTFTLVLALGTVVFVLLVLVLAG